MSASIVTKVYKCEEGHNFIVLDKNFDDIEDINVNEVYCPVCSGTVITATCRVIKIGY